MQLRLTKHLALQPLMDIHAGLAGRTTTCDLLPAAVLTYACMHSWDTMIVKLNLNHL